MTAATLTLADFLLARIAEDEAEFDRDAEAEAEACRRDGMPDTTADEIKEFWLSEPAWRWRRVWAEVDAKRRIVAECRAADTMLGDDVLRLTALPYADHPDYQPEWRP